jgi:uncharacterized iron-regulated membrane protein
MRAKLVKLHRVLGLSLGTLVFLIFASGAMLAFDEEITHLLDAPLIRHSPARVTVDQIEASCEKQLLPGEMVARIYLPLNKVRVQNSSGRRILYFHPQDGRYLGQGSSLPLLCLALHRQLLLGKTGRWIVMGGVAVILALSLSGLKLWWPRHWKKWQQSFTVKTTASRLRLVFDLHRVGGVYLLLPILALVISGLNFSVISKSYRSAVLALTRTGPIPPPPASSERRSVTLEKALGVARKRFPQASPTSIELPKKAGLGFKIRMRQPGQPGLVGRTYVVIDTESAEILQAVDASKLTLGQRMVNVWAFPFHRGRAFGRPQQYLWLLVGVAGSLIPVTGLLMWSMKRWRRKNNPHSSTV